MMVVGLMPELCHEHFEADKLKRTFYNFFVFLYTNICLKQGQGRHVGNWECLFYLMGFDYTEYNITID